MSIHKRTGKNGTTYRVIVRGVERSAPTKGEARALEATMIGKTPKRNAITVTEYFERWITTYTGKGKTDVRQSTLGRYRLGYDLHMKPVIGDKRLATLTQDDMEDVVSAMQAKHLQPSTIQTNLNGFKPTLASAVRDGILDSNPALGVVVKGDEPDKIMVFTEDEITSVLSHIPEWHRLQYQVMNECGLRAGEVAGLQWQDFLGDSFHIERTYSKGKLGPTKGGRPRNVGRITLELGNALRARREHTRFDKDTDPIFPTSTGRARNMGTDALRIFRPACEAAGVPWGHHHTVRHTWVSRLLYRRQPALDPAMVAKLAGHRDLNYLLRTYAHLGETDLPDLAPAEPNLGISLAQEPYAA